MRRRSARTDLHVAASKAIVAASNAPMPTPDHGHQTLPASPSTKVNDRIPTAAMRTGSSVRAERSGTRNPIGYTATSAAVSPRSTQSTRRPRFVRASPPRHAHHVAMINAAISAGVWTRPGPPHSGIANRHSPASSAPTGASASRARATTSRINALANTVGSTNDVENPIKRFSAFPVCNHMSGKTASTSHVRPRILRTTSSVANASADSSATSRYINERTSRVAP